MSNHMSPLYEANRPWSLLNDTRSCSHCM